MSSLATSQVTAYFDELKSMITGIILDLEKVNYSLCQEMQKQVPEKVKQRILNNLKSSQIFQTSGMMIDTYLNALYTQYIKKSDMATIKRFSHLQEIIKYPTEQMFSIFFAIFGSLYSQLDRKEWRVMKKQIYLSDVKEEIEDSWILLADELQEFIVDIKTEELTIYHDIKLFAINDYLEVDYQKWNLDSTWEDDVNENLTQHNMESFFQQNQQSNLEKTHSNLSAIPEETDVVYELDD